MLKLEGILDEQDLEIFLHRGSNDSNSKYLVNYQASDAFYITVSEEGRELFISEVEFSQAKDESNADNVRSFSDYSDRDVRGNISEQAKLLVDYLIDKDINGFIGVGPKFPSLLTKSLEESGFEVKVLDENPVDTARMIKTEEELENMRSIQQKTENAMKEVRNVLKASEIGENDILYYEGEKLTSDRIREIIRDTVPNANFPIETLVASGKESGDPHKLGKGPLEAHQPIVVDIFPRGKHGYFGDMTRTFVKGEASDRIKKMHEASLDALENALEKLKPGVNAEEIHDTALETVESHGFKDKEDFEGYLQTTGHSLGLDLHEPPRLTKGSIDLKKNMVITVEPGLYYPDEGGVRTEDMIRVTEDGYENFNNMESSLIHVD